MYSTSSLENVRVIFDVNVSVRRFLLEKLEKRRKEARKMTEINRSRCNNSRIIVSSSNNNNSRGDSRRVIDFAVVKVMSRRKMVIVYFTRQRA